MRYVYACMVGICFTLLWLGCSEDGKNTVSVEYLVVSDTLIYDTVVVKTIVDTSNVSGTLTSTVSDTVVSIQPKADSMFWLMVTSAMVYNTNFLQTITTDSLVLEMLIYGKQIYDTISTLPDTISDTIIVSIDSLEETYVTVSKIIDTVSISIDTLVSALDTHFVTTYLFATTGDSVRASGNIGVAGMDWLVLDTVFPAAKDLLPINANSSVHTFNNTVYILEGGGEDNVLQIEGPAIDSVAKTLHIGTNVDIRDISFVNESKSYITRYNSSMLIEYNQDKNEIIDSIIIDSAATSLMISSEIYNSKLYVLCQRIDSVQREGVVVVLSTLDNSIVDSIKLTKTKPMSMDIAGGYLYVSCMGLADSADGGVVQIDLSANTVVGIVLAETDAVIQNFSDITMVSTAKGYIKATPAPGGLTYLYEFTPGTGAVIQVFVVDRPEGGVIYDGRYLYVADRSATSPGVLVINPVNNSVVAGPISMGTEPPNSLATITVSKKYFSK